MYNQFNPKYGVSNGKNNFLGLLGLIVWVGCTCANTKIEQENENKKLLIQQEKENEKIEKLKQKERQKELNYLKRVQTNIYKKRVKHLINRYTNIFDFEIIETLKGESLNQAIENDEERWKIILINKNNKVDYSETQTFYSLQELKDYLEDIILIPF